MIYKVIIFLVINFAALAIGSSFTRAGVQSDWYMDIAKAPWTPPGWVFGAAWTTIMICFSFYMAYLWSTADNRNLLIGLFLAQWILNVLWNPTFFYYHNVLTGLFIIVGLTLVVGFFLFFYWSQLKLKSTLVIPYFIWLIIASSLNAFIYFKN